MGPVDLRRVQCKEHRLRVRVGLEVSNDLAATVTIKNQGDEPIQVASPTSAAALSIVVFDRFWNAVQPEAQGKANVAYDELSLGPGEAQDFRLDDLAFTSGTARFVYQLGSGRHHVVAVYHPGTSRLPDESDYPTVVASNVVTVDL